MHIIDSRVRVGIEDWWERYQLPLHEENVKKIDSVVMALNQFKGSWKTLTVIGGIVVIIVNHYWK